MGANASPRMARFDDASGVRKIIMAKITDGPQSEIGKTVHVRVTYRDLPYLRMLIEDMEASDDC